MTKGYSILAFGKRSNMDSCDHKNWQLTLDCMIGNGYCLDCKRQVLLTILFNNLKERMEAIIAKYEEKEQQ